MTKSLRAAAIAGLLMVAGSPAAATTVLNFGGGSSATSGAMGNVRTFNAAGGLQVQASAWSYNGSALAKAWLGWYGSGLGVTDGSEGSGTTSSSHAVDNNGQRNFVLLIFNQAVSLHSGVLTPYQQVSAFSRDNDATISTANVAGLFSAGTASLTTSSSLFPTLLANQWSINGNTTSPFATAFSPSGQFGNVWVVGARVAGGDAGPDGFKLTSLTLSAVPEPGTWLMMLVGFGAIGASMRRRQPVRSLRQPA